MSQVGISVLVAVYNEEKRISSFLKNFAWTDDLVVVDKSSTDGTGSIVRQSRARHIVVPYSDGAVSGMEEIARSCRHEWILIVTASDLIHPAFVKTALELINRKDFPYDIIEYPNIYYAFGLRDKRSPWEPGFRNWLARKSVFVFQNVVHHEISFSSSRMYHLPSHPEHGIHHLTHENLDSYFERHHRYARLEVAKYRDLSGPQALKKVAMMIFYTLRSVVVEKKTFLMGWDGVGLSLAYVSYFIFIFLYVWQDKMGRGPQEYHDMRNRFEGLWRDRD